MNKTITNVLGGLVFAAIGAAPTFAQVNSFTLNSDLSIATVSVANSADENSKFLMGIGRVTGNAALDAKNPGNASFTFTIFSSGPRSTPVNSDGTWADGQIPNTATYTMMTFKSKHAQLLDDGRLQLTGDLKVTHVERPIVLSYSEDYGGPKYGTPEVHSTTREARFALDLNGPDSTDGQDPKAKVVTGSSVIKGEDLPGLLDAVQNTNWPSVIGYVAEENQPSQSQLITIEDYPATDAFSAPPPNEVAVHVRLILNPEMSINR